MKVGLVGTIAVFRQVPAGSGMSYGQIDVIQYGDHKYPTQIHSIDVMDSTSCRVLLEVLEQNPNPLIRCVLWLDVVKGELKNTLIQLISADESILHPVPAGSGAIQ